MKVYRDWDPRGDERLREERDRDVDRDELGRGEEERWRPAPGKVTHVARRYGGPGQSRRGKMGVAPGKVTLTQSLTGGSEVGVVQARAPSGLAGSPDEVRSVAAAGVRGAGRGLPYFEEVQALLGDHDVSGVRAHVDSAASEAAQALGAEAYAMGDHIAFAANPDLFTVAHEVAHVVQQRAGVQLVGGVGQAGDAYEQQADRVATAVARGESAAGLVGPVGSAKTSASTPAVQRKDSQGAVVAAWVKHIDDTHTRVGQIERGVGPYLYRDAAKMPAARARMLREWLLLQSSEPSTEAELDRLLGDAAKLSASETKTLVFLRKSKLLPNPMDYPQAFPETWAKRVDTAMRPVISLADARSAKSLAWTEVDAVAETLPPYLHDHGLPVSLSEAMTLASFHVGRRHLGLGYEHRVKKLAREIQRYGLASEHEVFARRYHNGVDGLVDSIRAGDVTVDVALFQAFEAERRRAAPDLNTVVDVADQGAMLFRSLLTDVVDPYLSEKLIVQGAVLTSVLEYGMAWRRADRYQFLPRLGAADARIAGASGGQRLALAHQWANERGYPGAVFALVGSGLRDQLPAMIIGAAKDEWLLRVPYLNVLYAGWLTFKALSQAYVAARSLEASVRRVCAADTVVALQREAGRLTMAEGSEGLAAIVSILDSHGSWKDFKRSVARVRVRRGSATLSAGPDRAGKSANATGKARGVAPDLADTVTPEHLAGLRDRFRAPVHIAKNRPELGASVHVELDVSAPRGKVKVKRVVLGPQARLMDVHAHLPTVKLVRRYSGLVGRLRRVVDQLISRLGGAKHLSRLAPGSPHFKAWLELDKLPRLVALRRRALADASTPAGLRMVLTREVRYIEQQIARYRTILDDAAGAQRDVLARQVIAADLPHNLGTSGEALSGPELAKRDWELASALPGRRGSWRSKSHFFDSYAAGKRFNFETRRFYAPGGRWRAWGARLTRAAAKHVARTGFGPLDNALARRGRWSKGQRALVQRFRGPLEDLGARLYGHLPSKQANQAVEKMIESLLPRGTSTLTARRYRAFRHALRKKQLDHVMGLGSRKSEYQTLLGMLGGGPVSAKGPLFSEYLRRRLGVRGVRGLRGLRGVAGKRRGQAVKLPRGRRADDVAKVTKNQTWFGGPPRGTYLVEHKAGDSFNMAQARKYAEDIKNGAAQDGVIYVCEDAARAKAVSKRVSDGKLSSRIYVGYIDPLTGVLEWAEKKTTTTR